MKDESEGLLFSATYHMKFAFPRRAPFFKTLRFVIRHTRSGLSLRGAWWLLRRRRGGVSYRLANGDAGTFFL